MGRLSGGADNPETRRTNAVYNGSRVLSRVPLLWVGYPQPLPSADRYQSTARCSGKPCATGRLSRSQLTARSLSQCDIDAACQQLGLIFDPRLRHVAIIETVSQHKWSLAIAANQRKIDIRFLKFDAGETPIRKVGQLASVPFFAPCYQLLGFCHRFPPHFSIDVEQHSSTTDYSRGSA